MKVFVKVFWNVLCYDHTDFGPQIPLLGSEGLFSFFWLTKVCFFLLPVQFPIDGYITRPYWCWALNSVFGLWRLIFTFLIPKGIFFLVPCKIPNRWIYHMTILILSPKFRFWALKAFNIFSCSILWSPNSVF
jgi:hypothetical protein